MLDVRLHIYNAAAFNIDETKNAHLPFIGVSLLG